MAIQEPAPTCLQIGVSSVEAKKKTTRVAREMKLAQATQRRATEGTRRIGPGSSEPAAQAPVRRKQRTQATDSDD